MPHSLQCHSPVDADVQRDAPLRYGKRRQQHNHATSSSLPLPAGAYSAASCSPMESLIPPSRSRAVLHHVLRHLCVRCGEQKSSVASSHFESMCMLEHLLRHDRNRRDTRQQYRPLHLSITEVLQTVSIQYKNSFFAQIISGNNKQKHVKFIRRQQFDQCKHSYSINLPFI